MQYICLDCDHEWARRPNITHIRCPNSDCRSSDVAPASFHQMVQMARDQGINHNTPFRDLIVAFQAVFLQEGLLSLGVAEFSRIMNRVIQEVENSERRTSTSDIQVDMEKSRH